MAFKSMMGPGQQCGVDGQVNPLAQFLDSAALDPMQAQMMGGAAAQMGPMQMGPMQMGPMGAEAALLDPYQAGPAPVMPHAQGLEEAWGATAGPGARSQAWA